MDDAEFLFYQDVKDKAKTSKSAYSKVAIKRGSIGKYMWNHYTQKEIEEKHGKVKRYSMYDNLENLMSYNDFMKLNRDDRIKVLEKFAQKHSCTEIAKHWGIHVNTIYNLKYKLGIKGNSKYNTYSRRLNGEGDNMEMVDFKNELVSFEQYKLLSKENRIIAMRNLIEHFKRIDGSPDVVKMAGFWQVKKQVVYDYMRLAGLNRARLERQREIAEIKDTVKQAEQIVVSDVNREDRENREDSVKSQELVEVKTIEKQVIIEKPVYVEKPFVAKNNEEIHTYAREHINGRLLAEKLIALSRLVEDGYDYEVTIKLVERFKKDDVEDDKEIVVNE